MGKLNRYHVTYLLDGVEQDFGFVTTRTAFEAREAAIDCFFVGGVGQGRALLHERITAKLANYPPAPGDNDYVEPTTKEQTMTTDTCETWAYKLTPDPALRALRAIKARIDGVFDDPDLVSFGPLDTNPANDVQHIVESTLMEIGEASNATSN